MVAVMALLLVLAVAYSGHFQNGFHFDDFHTITLPNLNARVALGAGAGPGLTNYAQGTKGGQDCVTLDLAKLPLHSHAVQSSAGGPRVKRRKAISPQAEAHTTSTPEPRTVAP